MLDEIIYCSRCGRILMPRELAQGSCVQLPDGAVCPRCTASLGPEEIELLKSGRRDRPSRRAASAAAPRRSHHTSRRSAAADPNAEQSAGVPVVVVVGGVLVFLMIPLIVWGMMGSDRSAESPPPIRAPVARVPSVPTPAPPAALTPSADASVERLRTESARRTEVTPPANGSGDAPSSETGAREASFQDGVSPDATYRGTRDTYLREHAPQKCFGGKTKLLADGDEPGGTKKKCATLLRWDLAAVPVGSRVRSARVTIKVVDTSRSKYELRAMRCAWSESEATWRQASAGRAWTEAGGCGESDRGPVLCVFVPKRRGPLAIDLPSEGVALVQTWVDSPEANYGVVIAPAPRSRDGLDLASRESKSTASRPELVITYGRPVE